MTMPHLSFPVVLGAHYGIGIIEPSNNAEVFNIIMYEW
jgi:hypothetical protein